ncbi:hypothetical protein [Mycolicibacterium arenosum]|nr:hypothetical protein [Mycolicibacterium sp. CAU 1645]
MPSKNVTRWKPVAAAIGVIAVGAAAAVGGFAVGRESSIGPMSSRPNEKSVEQWWTDHRTDVAALRSSIHKSQVALEREDLSALSAACLTMHDDAVITLKSDLPAPERELDSKLRGAIEDAHAASHMCLAAEAGSINNYAGEFRSQMAASDRQLKAAEDSLGGHPATA